jgi:hypothetical protein
MSKAERAGAGYASAVWWIPYRSPSAGDQTGTSYDTSLPEERMVTARICRPGGVASRGVLR